MKSENSKPSDSITILFFLLDIRRAFDRNAIYECADMWLFQHFLKDPAKAALERIISGTKEEDPEQEESLTTYCQEINYLLATYATDDAISVSEADIISFKQQEGIFAVRY